MSPSFFENKKYWMHELEGINSSLPKTLMSIKKLGQLDKKGFTTKNGFQYISDEEYSSFCSNFSSEMQEKILVPIVLIQKGDHFVTSGNKYAQWAIEHLMGHESADFILSIADYKPKYSYYYTYQVNTLRRKFPTLIQPIFSMA